MRQCQGRGILAVGVGMLVGVAMGHAPAAYACGGTFCDGATGQPPMPVDQTGENILFIQDGPAIEAHIQIQYTGEPQRFAWVVPVPSVPTFTIGSDLLFRELLRSSAPSYQVLPAPADACAEQMAWWLALSPLVLLVPLVPLMWAPFVIIGLLGNVGCGAALDEGLADREGPDATVVYRDSVGSFDITILQAATSEEIVRWLETNQYNVPVTTLPIIRQYTAENYMFAAIKLVSTASVDEIHPIVMRYDFGVPCVPLRLTAVAAASDMGVRTFFLGSARTVPRRYRHVEVNPAQIDWLRNAINYKDVISRAVDDPTAEGLAFVTEYAGPSSVVIPTNFAWWTPGLRVPNGVDSQGVIGWLSDNAFMDCVGFRGNVGAVTGVTPPDSCTFFHPLVRGLLLDHLPPPTGTSERAYWSSQPDAATFDAAAFKEDFDNRVAIPGDHARTLAASHPYLTRMFTTISPEEMTVDPEFHERTDLPDVTNVNIATSTLHCDGYTTVALPDGREVVIKPDNTWPTFPQSMPFALTVDDIPTATERINLANRSLEVDRGLSAWNSTRPSAPAKLMDRCACAEPGTGSPWWAGLLLLVVARGWRRAARG